MRFVRSTFTATVLAVALLTLTSGCTHTVDTSSDVRSVSAPSRPHDFAKWEAQIAAYEADARKNPPPAGAIVFTGSSTIRLWKTLQDDFPEHEVINRGVGGCEILDVTHFAERIIIPYRPRMVLVAAGTNDINNGVSPDEVFADFKELVRVIHGKLPDTRVVFLGLNPRISRWNQRDQNKQANKLIEQFANRTRNVGYIEAYDMTVTADGQPRKELFAPDNLHFNAEGYRKLAELIRPHLEK